MNPSISNEYAKLKTKLAEAYKFDREAYTDKKTEFISEVTRLAKEGIEGEKDLIVPNTLLLPIYDNII